MRSGFSDSERIVGKITQSHQGLHGIGNSNTNSHHAQFGGFRFGIFSDSIR